MTEPWDDTFERLVRAAIAEFAAGLPLRPETRLPACGLDSLGMVRLSMALENAYGFEFADHELVPRTFATAGSLWTAVTDGRGRGVAP